VRVATNGNESWDAIPVISAVPWFALADLLEGDSSPLAATLDATRAMKPSPITTVNLWFDQPVLDLPFAGLPGRALRWVFEKAARLDDGSAHVSLVSGGPSPLAESSDADVIAIAQEELRGAFPRARGARLLRATVVREPRATFSLAPGQPARPSTATNVPGFYLAGDWVATGLPATIESAVRSGHLAAAATTAFANP
jgi:zeta-carotene desaturase